MYSSPQCCFFFSSYYLVLVRLNSVCLVYYFFTKLIAQPSFSSPFPLLYRFPINLFITTRAVINSIILKQSTNDLLPQIFPHKCAVNTEWELDGFIDFAGPFMFSHILCCASLRCAIPLINSMTSYVGEMALASLLIGKPIVIHLLTQIISPETIHCYIFIDCGYCWGWLICAVTWRQLGETWDRDKEDCY